MKTFVKCNRRIALLLVLLLTTALLAGCTEDEPEIRKPYSKPVGNESTPTPEATVTLLPTRQSRASPPRNLRLRTLRHRGP